MNDNKRMIAAAERGDVQALRAVLDRGVNVDYRDAVRAAARSVRSSRHAVR
jgi:hypothetical protein